MYYLSLDAIDNYQDWLLSNNHTYSFNLRSQQYNNYVKSSRVTSNITVSKIDSTDKHETIIRSDRGLNNNYRNSRNTYYFTYNPSDKLISINVTVDRESVYNLSSLYVDNKDNVKTSVYRPTFNVLTRQHQIDIDTIKTRLNNFVDDLVNSKAILPSELRSPRQNKRYRISRGKKR